ncbi:MAG: glycosyltransferase [Dehalococcoidia bacterium]|nr:glycosyltransferase [Dehalococcoidia bacterium]
MPRNMTIDNTVFVLISFEGPDRYSMAGGLGVRVEGLSNTLTSMGFPAHLVFVGDPAKKGEEVLADGRLTLHRWCQWISRYYPNGVYEGEYEKMNDLAASLPGFLIEQIVKQAVSQGRVVVIMAEEWQTAEAICSMSDHLALAGLRDRVIMFWNANNTFGFDRIDWARLSRSVRISTVSRYMKHLMWNIGVNPLVIPNGIDPSLLEEVDETLSVKLRRMLDAELVLAKVARWDPDKRWRTTIEAIARLKDSGKKTVLLARGGIEPHREEILDHARSLGLSVNAAFADGEMPQHYLAAIAGAGPCEIIDIRSHVTHSFLRTVYHASDAVLANSGHEPFGLVGLETMAAEGVAFTGGTGEDYALPYYNSIVLETDDPAEIELALSYLKGNPEVEARIRKAARQTAGYFTWEEAVRNLIRKLEYQGEIQGLLARPTGARSAPPPVSSVTAGSSRTHEHVAPRELVTL